MVKTKHNTQHPRSGITLLEVVLALAIFIAAFAVISQILNNGSRTATKAQLTSEAVFRCEKQMNSLLSGVVPLQSASQVPFDDISSAGTGLSGNNQWRWTANVLESGITNLLQVEVIVEHIREVDGQPNASFMLTRLIRDPQMYFDAALESTGDL